MRALKIGTLGGIPIKVHWSFVVALPLFALWWSLSLTIGLFLSVLLHELAHAIYARRHGARVHDIILLPIGGVSRIERPPRKSRDEALMALAGPLVSLALGGLGLAAFAALPDPRASGAVLVLGLGQLNLLLGLFNLLPAFPMDGGRVLRAVLSGRMGHVRATRIAAMVGKVFAALFVAAGIIFTDIILAVIGAFVWFGAEAERRESAMESALSRVRVRDVMTPSAGAIPAAASVRDAAEQLVRERHLAAPVVALDGRVVGVLSLREVQRVPGDQLDLVQAGDAARTTPEVSPDEDAWQALATMGERQVPLLPVVERGHLVGAVDQAMILRDAELRQAAGGPPEARG